MSTENNDKKFTQDDLLDSLKKQFPETYDTPWYESLQDVAKSSLQMFGTAAAGVSGYAARQLGSLTGLSRFT